ncbi:MAG: nitrilase-related carbon-nitrogen hydrolase [Bacteriovoracia bacterium]
MPEKDGIFSPRRSLALSLVLLGSAALSSQHANAEAPGRVAAIQFAAEEPTPLNVTPDEAQRYQKRMWNELAKPIRQAAAAGAELVVTPELSAAGYPADDYYTRDDVAPHADTIPGRATRHFGALAKELGIYLHIGLIERRGERYFNAVVALNPQGGISASYRKINLFGMEPRYFDSGRELASYVTPFGRVAMIICADVYNAYPMKSYRDQGIQLFAMGASWTVSSALASFSNYARSNAMHLIAANTPYFPGSAVVRPDGSLQGSVARGAGVAYGTWPRKRKKTVFLMTSPPLRRNLGRMSLTEIQKIESEIMQLSMKLQTLRAEAKPQPVKNYSFQELTGETNLLDLFADKDVLFVIHNMGQGCRYCTLWADGLNGFLPHLEDRFAVALVSKDSPADQRRIANQRGWRFRMASHGGGAYIQEQSVTGTEKNAPGLVCYVREGQQIFKKNSAVFGPGDLYCSIWHVLGLGGFNAENWTPQYTYWKRPEKLDDGGNNVL